jgi:hypothetical protein
MKLVPVLTLVLCLAAPAAFAHAHLTAETPAAKATISAAPAALVLTFTESVALHFTGVTVTGPDKTAVRLGAETLSKDGTSLTVPLAGTLSAGTYEVAWHALSTDGHRTKGSYSFTVK